MTTEITGATYTCENESCGMRGKVANQDCCRICSGQNVLRHYGHDAGCGSSGYCQFCMFEVWDWELELSNDCPNCGAQIQEEFDMAQLTFDRHCVTDAGASSVIRILGALLYGAKHQLTARHVTQEAELRLEVPIEAQKALEVTILKRGSRIKIDTEFGSTSISVKGWFGMDLLEQNEFLRAAIYRSA